MADFKDQKEKDEYIRRVQQKQENAKRTDYQHLLKKAATEITATLRGSAEGDTPLYDNPVVDEFMRIAGEGKTEDEKYNLGRAKKEEITRMQLENSIDDSFNLAAAAARALNPPAAPPPPAPITPKQIVDEVIKKQQEVFRGTSDIMPGAPGELLRGIRSLGEYTGAIPPAPTPPPPPAPIMFEALVEPSHESNTIDAKRNTLDARLRDLLPSQVTKGPEGLLNNNQLQDLEKESMRLTGIQMQRLKRAPEQYNAIMDDYEKSIKEVTEKMLAKDAAISAKPAGGTEASEVKYPSDGNEKLGTLKKPGFITAPERDKEIKR